MSDPTEISVWPMFPLGQVLFPYTLLPLRIFEPRFRQLLGDCVAGDGRFGVVLIERGQEVGGGDTRFTIGTVAQIRDIQRLPDGSWAVNAVGLAPLRVSQWLTDNPYPNAFAEPLPAAHEIWGLEGLDPADLRVVVARLRETLELCARLGDPAAPPDVVLSDDFDVCLWQACSIAPVSPLDELALLGAPSAADRMALLRTLLDDASLLLSHRLSPE